MTAIQADGAAPRAASRKRWLIRSGLELLALLAMLLAVSASYRSWYSWATRTAA